MTNTLTRILAILLCIGLIISFSACGKNEDTNSSLEDTIASNSEQTSNDDISNSNETSSNEDKVSSDTESTTPDAEMPNNATVNNSTSSNSSSSTENTSSMPEDNIIEKPNHTHTYKSKTISPTCTTKGYTQHTCSCGSTYTDSQKSAFGHSWGSWVTTKEPTYATYGTQERTCKQCSISETQNIESLKEPYTQAEFEELVCAYTLQYINDYRMAEGSNALTKFTGKGKQFAELRSEQLSINFAHDTDDYRNAATQIQYGEHIIVEETKWDPIKQEEYYTGNILNYYEGHGREAIARLNGICVRTKENAEEKASEIASMCYNSSGHWAYVGSNTYTYGVIGVYFDGWQLYVTILVGTTNKYD